MGEKLIPAKLRSRAPLALSAAAAIVGLALAGGGASATAVGVGAALVWLLLGGLLAGGGLSLQSLSGPLAVLLGLAAAYAGWTALSIGWASDAGAAFDDLLLALLYLGALLIVGLASRPGSARSWLIGIALGGTIVAVIALLARFGGFGDQDIATELRIATDRLSYPLGYWNALGYLMTMTLASLIWLADRADRLGRAALAATVPVVLTIFLTSSRGAILAAILAGAVVIAAIPARTRLVSGALIAVPAWAIAIATLAVLRSELDPLGGISVAGVGALLALVAVTAGAYLLSGRVLSAESLPRPRALGRPGLLLGIVLLAAVAVGAIAGPSSFIGEFRTERDGRAFSTTSEALASGSGRSDFWGTALDAFAEEPLRGVGAGGYESYWTANGELAQPTRNAHSAPLEVLAELGAVGGALLAGILIVTLAAFRRSVRGARERDRGVHGAYAAVLVAGLLAISLDWTWELVAAAAPLVIVIGAICGGALRATPAEEGPPSVAPGGVPLPLLAGSVAAVGVAAIACGAILALSSVQLDRAEARLADGDLGGAAGAARAAARIQPWSAEPQLALASIEQAGANLASARRRAQRAIALDPEDFRAWVVLAEVEAELGNPEVASSYRERAEALGGRVLRGAR